MNCQRSVYTDKEKKVFLIGVLILKLDENGKKKKKSNSILFIRL